MEQDLILSFYYLFACSKNYLCSFSHGQLNASGQFDWVNEF